MKHVKTRQQFSFSFPELRYSSLEFNSTKIPKTCQIEWNRIRENKRNEVRDNANSIFKWRFRHRRCCLSSLMALRWRRNVDFLGCYLLVSVPLNQCWSEGKHQEHLSNSVEMSLKPSLQLMISCHSFIRRLTWHLSSTAWRSSSSLRA